jgi:Tfp pilus assembly protein PilE
MDYQECSNRSLPVADDDHSALQQAYQAVIGPKQQAAYLRYFTKADGLKQTPVSWHWPAFFVTFLWLLYRKMWGAAFIYFLAPALFFVFLTYATAATGNSSGMLFSVATLAYCVLAFMLPPLYANAMYYRHCQKEIARARKTSTNREQQLGMLSRRGGTGGVVLAGLILGAIAIMGFTASIALSAFEDYKVRAAVTDAHRAGQSASAAVGAYFNQNKRFPSTLDDAGFTPLSTTLIRSVTLNATSGTISVTMARPPNDDKSLLLVPTPAADRALVWKCQSDEIGQRHLPPACRK